MHRLSLMCEVSAALLTSSSNVVEALTMSAMQKSISGNDLPRLRRAAMVVILRRGPRGVSEIGRSSFFRKALEEERSMIVPTLLQSTQEILTHWEKTKGVKRVSSELHNLDFLDLDRKDIYNRALERDKRRRERRDQHDEDCINEYSADEYAYGEHMASKRALDMMLNHDMDVIRRDLGQRVMQRMRTSGSRKRCRRSSNRSGVIFGNRET